MISDARWKRALVPGQPGFSTGRAGAFRRRAGRCPGNLKLVGRTPSLWETRFSTHVRRPAEESDVDGETLRGQVIGGGPEPVGQVEPAGLDQAQARDFGAR